jgi:hypothetical protein
VITNLFSADDPLRRNAAFASLVRMPSAHRQEQGRGRQAATFTAQQQLREPQELEALNSLLHLVVLHVSPANFLSLLEVQGPVR